MSKETDPSAYGSDFERIPKDRYWTEPWVTSILLRRLQLDSLPNPIWEPCAGRGDMSKVLLDNGIPVIASDIDMGEFDAGDCPAIECDFLKDPLPKLITDTGFSAIVTNPPYDKHEECLRRALNLNCEIVAMLLRSDFNQAAGRSELFSDPKYMFAYEIILTTRPRWDWWFRDKQQAAPRFGFSWFVFDKGQFEYNPTTYWENKNP